MKDVKVLIGNYGSGKSELALNFAFKAAETGKTELIDLDLVNTYFRLTERGKLVEQKEIRLISPNYACSGVETLSLPAEGASAFAMNWDTVVFDVGGDAVGSTALGRYYEDFQDFMAMGPEQLEVLNVVNIRRPLAGTVEKIIDLQQQMEIHSHLKITGMINNTNLATMTTPAELRDGATSAVKRIDDLAANTAYFGYCYAEDAYGDRMSNSVESTRFAVTTRAEALWWNATLAANSTTAAVEAASNRNLTFCCVLRRDEEPVAFDDVMNGGLCVAVPALQPTTLFSGVEDNTQYWVTCAARTDSFEELLFDAPAPLLTAARAPILALEAVRPTYHSLEVTLRSDRPGHAWCLALSEAESTASTVPSVEAIKEGAAGTLVADGLADVYVEGLAAETLYQVWCYAETAEGLPMQNTLQSLHVAQRTFPCGLR